MDWRKNEPILLAIGPVLHADDAVANKVCALFGRVRKQREITGINQAFARPDEMPSDMRQAKRLTRPLAFLPADSYTA